VQCPNGIV